MSAPRPGSAPMPALAERWDLAAGWRIFSRGYFRPDSVGGHGSAVRLPVVCVHGLSMSSRYMVPLARRLARTWNVCAPDLPGFGLSPHPPRPLSIPGLAGALLDWMDRLGLERAHLVGNSMGCQVIAALAACCPERVGRLVLFGPSMDPRVLPLPRLGLRGAVNMLFEQVSFYPVLVGDYLRAGVRETFTGLQDSIHAPTLAHFRDVSAPALVIRGKHDWLVTEAHCRRAAQALPLGRMASLGGGGHVVHYSAPDAAAALVRAFLEGRGEFADDNRTSV